MSRLVEFKHEDQRVPDHGVLPPPCSWDYAPRLLKEDGVHYACQSDKDLVLATCSNGHTCRLVSGAHSIAADGTISPSYVCPAKGCDFHRFVRLLDWDPAHVYVVREL